MRSSWILLVVLHVAVLIHTGHSSCTLQIEKDRDFVLLEERAQVNCTSNCSGVSWETRLRKVSTVVRTDNFRSEIVQIKDYEDSPIECLVVTDDNSVYKDTVRVEAYALPTKVDIGLKKELEEDKEHEVKCSVDNVAPVKNVILSVTKGGEPFLSRTFENDTRRGPQNLRETFNFTASRRDNLQDFACQVTLNLTRVANTTVQSSPVTVSTFTLPEDPRITAEKWMERGTVTDISCEVLNAFPTENVTTRLFINHLSDLSVSRHASVSYTLNTKDLQPAQYEVGCESEVFSISKRSYKQIIIYERPKVNLTVSKKVVTLKDRVTIDCNLAQGNAEYFGLSINPGEKEVRRVANLTAEIPITKREPTLSVTCETFIADNDRVLLTSEEILTVHYPPLPPSVNISTSTTSPGGSVNLSCHSDSHPSPTYSWIIPPNAQVDFSKDNSSITIKEASTYHNGTYTCQVRNDYGNFSAIQSLEVKYDNTLWIALVGVVVGVLAAAIIGLVSYFLLQNGKKGFYDLVRRKHKSPDSAGIPLHGNGKV